MLMHRASFRGFRTKGRIRNPQRGQGRVLSILQMKPEISQKELTNLLGISKQSLAELLSKLEKSGNITREPSKEDRRAMIIKLTEEGRNAASYDGENETFEANQILDCLTDEELVTFSEYLNRIIKRYEEQFPNEDFEERRRHMEEFMREHGHRHGFTGFGESGENQPGFDRHSKKPGQSRGSSHSNNRKSQLRKHGKEHNHHGNE